MTIQQGEAIKATLAAQQPEPKPARVYAGKPGTVWACCELAVRVRCVCSASWKCPTHGSWCVGGHE